MLGKDKCVLFYVAIQPVLTVNNSVHAIMIERKLNSPSCVAVPAVATCTRMHRMQAHVH